MVVECTLEELKQGRNVGEPGPDTVVGQAPGELDAIATRDAQIELGSIETSADAQVGELATRDAPYGFMRRTRDGFSGRRRSVAAPVRAGYLSIHRSTPAP